MFLLDKFSYILIKKIVNLYLWKILKLLNIYVKIKKIIIKIICMILKVFSVRISSLIKKNFIDIII